MNSSVPKFCLAVHQSWQTWNLRLHSLFVDVSDMFSSVQGDYHQASWAQAYKGVPCEEPCRMPYLCPNREHLLDTFHTWSKKASNCWRQEWFLRKPNSGLDLLQKKLSKTRRSKTLEIIAKEWNWSIICDRRSITFLENGNDMMDFPLVWQVTLGYAQSEKVVKGLIKWQSTSTENFRRYSITTRSFSDV